MDDDLRKMIEKNRSLLLENKKILQENQVAIKKIQLHIRRTMVGKTIYWIVIVVITAGAIYYSKPYINSAIDTYQETRDNLNKSSEFINNPGIYLKDINMLQRIKGFFESE